MIKVGYTGDLGYKTKLVSEETTIKDFCKDVHLPLTNSSMVIVNDTTIQDGNFNRALGEYAIDGEVNLSVTAKMANA